jgi:hypothetical protein
VVQDQRVSRQERIMIRYGMSGKMFLLFKGRMGLRVQLYFTCCPNKSLEALETVHGDETHLKKRVITNLRQSSQKMAGLLAFALTRIAQAGQREIAVQ